MKREALPHELRDTARRLKLVFEVVENRGKGSHYRVRLGEKSTTIKSGELTPSYIRLIRNSWESTERQEA
jgi:hypothetical protein